MKLHYPIFILLVLAALALPALPRAAAQEGEGSGSVVPTAGGPGTVFNFTASGFRPGEQLGLWLIQPDGNTRPFGPETSDSRRFASNEGGLNWTWVPDELTPGGPWTAVVRGDVSRVLVQIPFQVINDLGNAPPASWDVQPAIGPPGTTFTFVGRSPAFIPREQLSSWFIMPDGNVLHVRQGMTIDPNGQFYRLWKAPDKAFGGEWVFRVVGISSGFNIDIRFTIDAPPAPPPPDIPVILEAAPDVGKPGTSFIFTASGFNSQELVSNWFVRPDGTSEDAASFIKADGNGVLRWQWTAPHDVPAGIWTWRLSGLQTAGYKEVPFTIERDTPLPPPPDIPPGTVFPASGPPDTVFTFGAEGFDPGEYVFFWAEAPNGDPVESNAEVRADAQGRLEWTWDLPASAVPGQWYMVTRGRISSTRVRIPFQAEPITRPEQQGVQPAIASPGVRVEFFARGYNSGEDLDIWIEGPNGYTVDIQGRTATQQGLATWHWDVAADAPVGQWRSVVLGYDSRVRVSLPFEILRDTPVPPDETSGVTPFSGPPGTTFTFFGYYERGEGVSYWLTDPDQEVVRATDNNLAEAFADRNGRVEVAWTAPLDAKRGIWQLTMRTSNPGELDNDITYTIRFAVE